MKIIITIAYWELYQLKWFDLNPLNTITDLLNVKLKQHIIRNMYYIINIFFGILFWIFLFGLLTMYVNNGKLLDIINIIIIIIPLCKFIMIYMCYIFICIRNIICLKENDENYDNPFQYWMKLNNLVDKGVIKIGNTSPKHNLKKESNELNCIEKLICKDIIFQISCKESLLKIKLETLLEIFFTILSFIYYIYLFCNKGASVGSVFFLTFVYLISLIISIQFPTPLWLINSIYRWYLKMKKRYDREHQIKCRIFNEKFGAFKVLDSLPLILSILLLIVFISMIIFFNSIDKRFYTCEEKINEEGKFKVTTNWKRESFTDIKNIENAICYTNIHGLSLLKWMSFLN
jgi:hypothetical protein